MKKLILLLLTLTLILGVFTSCNNKRYLPIDDETSSFPSEDTSSESTTGYITESNETDQTENTETTDILTEITVETQPIEYPENYTYTIQKIDGKWYMNFDSYVLPPLQEGCPGQREFLFTSIDALYNMLVKNKNFRKEDKVDIITLWYKYKTENGIEIINFDELYVPDTPSSLEMTWVRWERTAYGVSLQDKASGTGIGQVNYLNSSEDFYNMYNSLVQDENNYILTEGNKTIIVKKFQSNDGLDIDLYIKHGDRYCLVRLFNMTESPADEFFLQFGLEKWQKPE